MVSIRFLLVIIIDTAQSSGMIVLIAAICVVNLSRCRRLGNTEDNECMWTNPSLISFIICSLSLFINY